MMLPSAMNVLRAEPALYNGREFKDVVIHDD